MELKINSILLDALAYPLYAVPEFWIKAQRESGWSPETFFNFLSDECSLISSRRHLQASAKKIKGSVAAKNGEKLSVLTNGKVEWAYTLDGKSTDILNADLLNTIVILVEKTKKIAQAAPEFSHLQIVEFHHTGIAYMWDQFKIQTGQRKPDIFFGKSTSNAKEGHYVFYYYSLFSDIPLFDFYKYRNCFRELLLNSKNIDPLIKIAGPVSQWCNDIIDMFNDTIQPYIEPFGENEKLQGKAEVIEKICSFDEETFDFISHGSYQDTSTRTLVGKTLTNRQIAEFAFKVVTFLYNEVIPKSKKISSLTEKKYHVATYALVHVYWGNYDLTKRVTKTNKEVFAVEYGISPLTFFTAYNHFIDKETRLLLSDEKREQRNSVLPFIEKFEDAATILKDLSKPAYTEVMADLEVLKTRYGSYLKEK